MFIHNSTAVKEHYSDTAKPPGSPQCTLYRKNQKHFSKAYRTPSESWEGHAWLPKSSVDLLEALEMHLFFVKSGCAILMLLAAF